MNEPKKKFKLVTDTQARMILPNTLTLIGVCVGLSSINFALNQRYEIAIIAILFAAIIDGLDGRIARLIRGTSKVGKELDSLTDVISFGVAPAFIMYFWTLKTLGKIGWLLSLIYVVCVALRLARFNISSGGDVSWKDNFFQAEDGIRDAQESRGLGDVYKRQKLMASILIYLQQVMVLLEKNYLSKIRLLQNLY